MSRDDFGDAPKYCKHCGAVSTPRVKTVKEGSTLVGIFLLLLMILPGLLYFIFRMRTDSFWVCGNCGRRGGLIPIDSPVARAALQSQASGAGDVYCSACGRHNDSGAAYCSGCGSKLSPSAIDSSTKAEQQTYSLSAEPDSRYGPRKESSGLPGSGMWVRVVLLVVLFGALGGVVYFFATTPVGK